MTITTPSIPLSEAIRLGCLVSGNNPSGSFRGGRTCAMGAALLAVGFTDWHDFDALCAAVRAWDGEHGRILCPVPEGGCRCGCGKPCVYAGSLHSVIQHLHDTHGWSRERCADWVEQNFEQSRVGELKEAVRV